MEQNKAEIAERIGSNIRTWLKHHNRTVKQLAEDTGIEYSHLRKYMSGYLTMGVDKVPVICKALGCDANFLFTGTGAEDFNPDVAVGKNPQKIDLSKLEDIE
jgi:transcriptional regulator with XRE-family HTH domain